MFLPAIQPFELKLNWLQAQAFRWSEEGDWYYGVVHDSLIRVRNAHDGIEFGSDASDEALAPHVSHYFRLDQDISNAHEALRQVDDATASLVERYGHIRILRQDPWECLVAYICSQNNEVDDIAKIVRRLAEHYGTEVTLDGVTCHAFPTPRRLAAAGAKALGELAPGLGRGRRIHGIATDIVEGRLDLGALARMPHAQARAVLMSYDGIGAKIADCVSLFAFDNPEAFPVDRRIERGLKPHGQKYTANAPNAGLMEWVRVTFGANAGYAGQLMFLDQGPKS